MSCTMAKICQKFVKIKWISATERSLGPLGRIGTRNGLSIGPIVGRNWTRCLSYRAAVLKELGQPLVVEEVKESRKLQKDEVRIAVRCCGVNNSDVQTCRGTSGQNAPKLPFVPGFEVSGEVLEVGKAVSQLKVGDRVLSLNKINQGGFSEQCVAPEKDVWILPPEVDFVRAASLVDSYATAYLGLVRRAKIDKESIVLVTAAAGGLGLAAVDLAANVYGAKVIGVCGTEDKASLVRDKGAWAALSYHQKGMTARVAEITGGKGASVVFDAVGGDLFLDCLQCVAHEGKVIVAGFASRQIPTIPTDLLMPRSCALIGVSLSRYRDAAPDVYRTVVEEVIEMGNEQDVEPHVSATYNLEQVNEAFQYLEDRKSTGQVVLTITT